MMTSRDTVSDSYVINIIIIIIKIIMMMLIIIIQLCADNLSSQRISGAEAGCLVRSLLVQMENQTRPKET
jgi:hypothetical protein